jgi:predicted cobalt transporter CbtA
VVSILTGAALGLLFGLVYAVRHRDDLEADAWPRALHLAGAAFVGVALIPFLRYPANPPGVGDPGTVATRTSGYLLAVLIGLAAVTAAAQLSAALARRGLAPAVRHLATACVVLAGAALTWLLPPGSEATGIPPELLWDFRVAALATVTTLWLVLGAAAFGLLGERAAGRLGTSYRRGPDRSRT